MVIRDLLRVNAKARYTLFANNSEIGGKRRKTDVRRISLTGVCHVSRTGFSPYAVRRIYVWVAVSSTNTKNFFVEKKNRLPQLKLTANNEQCRATRLSRFRQHFIRRKNNFVSLFVMFANSV